ncbi:MAG: hypothetical protein ISQ32_02115 [Rickettsiales bacterium]|nr:hypothetical protein [Rickettsiales bacterium]
MIYSKNSANPINSVFILSIFLFSVWYWCQIFCTYKKQKDDLITHLRFNANMLVNEISHISKAVKTDLYNENYVKQIVGSNYKNDELKLFDPKVDNVLKEKILPIKLITRDVESKQQIFQSSIKVRDFIDQLFLGLDENVTFVLLDSNQNIIDSNSVELLLTDTEKLEIESYSLLNNAIKFQDNYFYHVRKLENLPFTLLVGYKSEYLQIKFLKLFFEKVMIFAAFILFGYLIIKKSNKYIKKFN